MTTATTPREPHSRAEWQDAVNEAHVWLLVDSARKYGLVRGGPVVNLERCDSILAQGRARGILPQQNAVKKFVRRLAKLPAYSKKPR